MKRLIICLSRPSRIGLVIKDKIYIPLLYTLAFFLLCLGIFAVKVFNTNYLINVPSMCLDYVHKVDTPLDISFDGNKLSGKGLSIEGNDLYLSFNNTDARFFDKLSFSFKEDYVVVSSMLLSKRINYTELKESYKFSLSDIQKNDIYAESSFYNFVNEIAKDSNLMYSVRIYILDSLFYLVMVGIAVAAVAFFSYLINPPIGMGIRMKLALYDTLIYFPFFMFSIFVNIDYIRYGGIFAGIVFAYFTFTHIVKVRINKMDN